MTADQADSSRADSSRASWWDLVVDSVIELRPSRTSREIGEAIEARLIEAGYLIIDSSGRQAISDEVAPEWASVLLDSLFTGSRLDFGGTPVPTWLRHRLDAEFGMPIPTGDPATRPAAPVDLDDEESASSVHSESSEDT